MEALIDVRGVGRRFRRREALRGVDLSVSPGEIVGLAGPNGSGKTTLLKLLAGLLRPTKGSVLVCGHDPYTQRAAVMKDARFAFAPPPLYGSLSAREHLVHLAKLGGYAPPRGEIDGVLETVGLGERARDRVRAFSFGMRQRLVLAQALLPKPKLIVLDEPTDGLDPLAVLELRGVLRGLREDSGVAVLLSSHLLVELDELVDRLLVLDEGRVLFQGPPSELCSTNERLRLGVADPDRAADVLRSGGYQDLVIGRGSVRLPAQSLSLEEARGLLAKGGVALVEYHVERPTLEDALLERLREGRNGTGHENRAVR